MNTDFSSAHDRHWDDAEMLFGKSRLANADHLYGVAVECGLKALMRSSGMAVDKFGNPTNPKDRLHANEIWDHYEACRSGRVNGPSYPLPQDNPFADWDVSQRYADQGNFTQERVTPHQGGAKIVHTLVMQARKAGQIS